MTLIMQVHFLIKVFHYGLKFYFEKLETTDLKFCKGLLPQK